MSAEDCVYLAKNICDAVGLAKVAVAELHSVAEIVGNILEKHKGEPSFEIYSALLLATGLVFGFLAGLLYALL